MNVLGLIQLCQAAQPVGGYGLTFGIDRRVNAGRLRSAEQLESLVTQVLRAAIAPADGVASGISFRAARVGEFERIPEVCSILSSPRMPAEMRRASLQMGERLWVMSRGWNWAASVHQQLDALAGSSDLHHAVAFGMLVSETTSSQVRAIATYLYNTAKSIILAAARAIPLEEGEQMQVLSSVQTQIAEIAAWCADKEAGDIVFRPSREE